LLLGFEFNKIDFFFYIYLTTVKDMYNKKIAPVELFSLSLTYFLYCFFFFFFFFIFKKKEKINEEFCLLLVSRQTINFLSSLERDKSFITVVFSQSIVCK